MGALRAAVERLVHELAVGAVSGAAARRALLPQLPSLAAFLGRKCVPALAVLSGSGSRVHDGCGVLSAEGMRELPLLLFLWD